ncbi:MAG: ATP-binding cassette domain-containing protein [Candidatus Dormibacteria bacterium]
MSAALARFSADGVVKRYGNGRGLGPVSVAVAAGETLALVGPNGSGKTTLLRIAATVARPQGGRLLWGGGDARSARASLGLALDAAPEDGGLTGRQATAFWCAQWVGDRHEVAARTDRILLCFDLLDAADDRVASYSYGMRRRLALAAALVHEPRLALLDEPTAGLDPDGVRRLTTLIHARRAAGQSTIVASNDVDFVGEVADRVGFLVGGRLVRCAPPGELMSSLRPGRLAEVEVEGGLDVAALRAVAGVREVSAHPRGATVRLDEDASVVALAAVADRPAGSLRGLRVRRPDLADAFAELTGRHLGEDS